MAIFKSPLCCNWLCRSVQIYNFFKNFVHQSFGLYYDQKAYVLFTHIIALPISQSQLAIFSIKRNSGIGSEIDVIYDIMDGLDISYICRQQKALLLLLFEI